MEAEVFESRSEVGGTWTPEMSYHGLQVHSPMYTMLGVEHWRASRFHVAGWWQDEFDGALGGAGGMGRRNLYGVKMM